MKLFHNSFRGKILQPITWKSLAQINNEKWKFWGLNQSMNLGLTFMKT